MRADRLRNTRVASLHTCRPSTDAVSSRARPARACLYRAVPLPTNKASHTAEERFTAASDVSRDFFGSFGEHINHVSAQLAESVWCRPSELSALARRLG
jgi:hypothetical protein